MCNPHYLLWELDVCGDHVFGVLSWFPRRLPDVDGSLSNLVDTVSHSKSRDVYKGRCVK